jgi:hypothetical protein
MYVMQKEMILWNIKDAFQKYTEKKINIMIKGSYEPTIIVVKKLATNFRKTPSSLKIPFCQ